MDIVTAALFGLIVGSFLNVCIHRLPRGESVVFPASHCTTCARSLRWYENIPVVSYLALRGRCRTCGERVSVMYPLIEATTGGLFVAVYLVWGVTPVAVARLLFVCAMLVLMVIDLQHQILPNEITVPGILLGLAASLLGPPGLRAALVGAALGGGVLWAVAWGYERWRHRAGIGFGDVKMLAMIGAFLGWQLALLTLVTASLLGTLVAGVLLAAGRAGWQTRLPLGTFLALAAIPVSLGGEAVVAWYLGFFP